MFDQFLGDVPTPLKFILAFAFVILLIVICAWLVRRYGGQRLGAAIGAGRSRQPRLGVLDVLAIDGRRRLVIVRRDNVEHLVMIGGPNDVVVESGILRVPAGMTGQRDAPALGPVEPQLQRPPAPPQAGSAQPAPPVAAPQDSASQAAGGPRVAAAAPKAAEAPARSHEPEPPARPALAPGQARAVAPQPARPSASEPRPAGQPIAAGPALRVGDPEARAKEIAERLTVALKRPVTPSVRPPAPPKPAAAKGPEPKGPEPKGPESKGPDPKSAEAKGAEPKGLAAGGPDVKAEPQPPAPEGPKPQIADPKDADPKGAAPKDADPKGAEPKGTAAGGPGSGAEPKPAEPKPAAPQDGGPKADGDGPPRETPQVTDKAEQPAKADAGPKTPGAPEVKSEPSASAGAPDDDPLASLEAEMASLLGRDVGKSK